MSLNKLFLGMTKSGKSYIANNLLKKISKGVVYDYANCFTNGIIIDDYSISNFMKLLKKYGGKKNLNSKFKLIFVRPRDKSHQDALDLVALFVTKLGQSYGVRSLPDNDLMAFVVDEADKCTSRKDSDRIRIAFQAGRHENIQPWAITQRPMKVHPDIRANATEIRAFPLMGEDKFYKENIGPFAVEKLKKAPKFSFIFWNDEGQKKLINKNGKVIYDFNKE